MIRRRPALRSSLQTSLRRLVLAGGALWTALLLLGPGCGLTPPSRLGFEIVVVNQTDRAGTVTYAVKARDYADPFESTFVFMPKSAQPSNGEVAHSRYDLTDYERLTFESLTFGTTDPSADMPYTDAPEVVLPVPDGPGKELIVGTDFGAGDTVYVTIHEDRVEVNVEAGYRGAY